MLIYHIAERDGGGGACQAAFKLHTALLALGQKSKMLVASTATNESNVIRLAVSASRIHRYYRRVRHRSNQKKFQKYQRSYSDTLEIFTLGKGILGKELAKQLPTADVYSLHWTRELVDHFELFRSMRAEKPILWRMPDMNAFTGGCHYTLGCAGFEQRCGACPQLGSKREKDLSREVHDRKRRAYAYLSPDLTRFVSPSRWLKEQAERSSLVSRFQVDHIPTGVDTETFQPRSRAVAREVFGLPLDEPVVLFAADSVSNHRKGFDLLQTALADLPVQATLAALGRTRATLATDDNPVVSLGRLEGPRLLSFAYSAADLFVLPTRADNLPNVALEAMACGTPVVSFDVGGMPDIVRPGHTGLLAPPEDVAGLRDAIATLLEDDELRARLGAEAREVAVREYGMELMARRYLAVYEELVEAAARRSHTPRPGTRPRA